MKCVHVVKIGDMRASDPESRGAVEVLDIPEQPLGEEDVRIRVAYCSICGSDPHLAEGIFGTEVPIPLGHEMSGTVIELGPKAVRRGLQVGDRVAGNFVRFCGSCYYCLNGQQQFCDFLQEYNRPCMAETVVWHESQVIKIPDSVSLRQACLLEPTSVAVRVMDKVSPRIGQRIAICGAGPVGLLTLQLAKRMGATMLTVIEPIEERRELALRLGADHAIDPLSTSTVEKASEITQGLGFDIVIDCSGSPRAVEGLPDLVAKGGHLNFAAMYPEGYAFPLELHRVCYLKEVTISGIFVAPYTFPRAVQVLAELQLDELTQAVFPIEEAAKAFEVHLSGEFPKVLIRCNEDHEEANKEEER